MRDKTILTEKQTNLISGGKNTPMVLKITINAPIININMNIGFLIVAGNTFNGGINTINFNQHI